MDVLSILRKKGQVISSYEIEVDGDQRESSHPHAFERFDIRHVVAGDVTEEALRRSIELSATRFCTVTSNLASGLAEIHHGYRLRPRSGDDLEGEVVVTGPFEGPDELGVGFRAAGAGPERALARP
jgi:putative redox protein